MYPWIAVLVLDLVLFAVDLTQAQTPVTVANRRDALYSSRLYSYSSALRMDAMVDD